MMRNILIMITAAMLSTICVKISYAADNGAQKLGRGLVNVATAPVEIIKEIRAHWITGSRKTDHILVWLGSGGVYGTAQMIKRAGSGVWDVITFPVARPEGYAPLLDPEFVFEEWPSR